MWSPRSQQIALGDVLLVRGDWDKIEEFRRQTHLRNAPEGHYAHADDRPRVMAEIMVAPASPLEGRKFGETGIGWRYDAVALAIHRRGQVLREKLSDVALAVGDVLLVLVAEEAMTNLRNDESFIVLSERENAPRTPRKALYAVAIMAAVVVDLRAALAADPDRRDLRRHGDGAGRLLRPQGRLRGHGLEDHHPARCDPAAGHRDREKRPVDGGGAHGHVVVGSHGPLAGTADDLPAHRAAHRADGAQPVGGADGGHRRLGGAGAARGSASVRGGGGVRRGHLVRHAGGLSRPTPWCITPAVTASPIS